MNRRLPLLTEAPCRSSKETEAAYAGISVTKAGLCTPGRPRAGTLQAERSVLWLAATPPTSARVQGDCTLGSLHRTGPVHAGGVIKELYFR